jgi:heme exporter protein C
MKRALVILCAVVALVGFLALPFLVFDFAPLAYELYINQKIFYYHVPAALVSFVAVFVCGISSVFFLVKRKPEYDDVAAAAGDLVVIFGGIVLTTGPIWAKLAWNTWWVWDARLTSTLLLWMIFVAYALLRRFGGAGFEVGGAGLAVFGMADVPLIYFAVNFWKTQHPTNNVVPTLSGAMRLTFWIAVVSYICLFVVLLSWRLSLRRAERRLAAAEDTALDEGVIA